MGDMVRSLEWAETALGPLRDWPQSLRTTVSIGLSSRFPILIWWGPDLVMVYNDALAGIIGNKHPRAMGQRGAEGWHEVWHVLGPMLTSVLLEGASTWSENQRLDIERTLQSGYLEETYFTFSYSPIRDESGGIGGVFCAVTETTAQVLGERRLRTLSTLAQYTAEVTTVDDACLKAAAAIEANPADVPAAFIYLEEGENDLRLAGMAGIIRSADQLQNMQGSAWPLDAVRQNGLPVIVEAAEVQRILNTMGCVTVTPPASALLLPLGPAGKRSPSGVMVVGLAPLLLLDERYRSFLILVAGHIGNAITSARALEAAEQRAAALAELDRAKTAFFSNVSHEFRTPLTLMLGPTEDAMAIAGGSLAGESLATVHRNGMRLLRLVNTLLDFSRIEAGRAEASFESTDLASLTTDLASAFRSTIERAGLQFEVRCDVSETPVYVDRDMWEKIVLNLLSNALKFTFEGAITVLFSIESDMAILTVRDTGVGIPEAEVVRVFDRFYRVEGMRSRTHEGTGIGLAFVRDLVQLHAGTVSVVSMEGTGSVFTVAIPVGLSHLHADRVRDGALASQGLRDLSFVNDAVGWLKEDSNASLDTALHDGLEGPPLPATTGLRILLVDDNADMREYVGRLLRKHWLVDTACDGLEALAIAQRQVPALVLTDVMMPILDGFGLLRALRADARTRAVPVLMLSARAGEESRIEGLAQGADDYLIKPFSAKELIARVGTHLLLGQLRRATEIERNRLSSLIDHAPAAIAVLRGADFIYELANAPYEALVQRHGIVGKSLVEVFPEVQDQPVHDILRRVFATGERFLGQDFLVTLARTPDATPENIYYDLVYEPFRGADGVVEGIMVLAFEVTERVLGARKLECLYAEREGLLERERTARADAERASLAKDEFMAMLGHELRNPLAPIVNALQLLRLRGADSAPREHAIIDRQVKHLTTLVDDLLDVSAITSGKIELKREHAELSVLLDRAIEIASPLLEQRAHVITVVVARDGLVVDADPTRMVQIISNLLTNAAKYTEPSGKIGVSARIFEERIELSVSDNGVGISKEMLPHVFELFMQERQAIDRARGGLGLGLAIVQNLMRMHDGTARAVSAGRGCGSTFTISLPAVRTIASAPTIAGEAISTQHNTGLLVLIVDDSMDAADTLAELVIALGFDVRVAYDGPSALRLMASFVPHLAFFDIGLPNMSGYELAQEVRKRTTTAIHLVALTGYGQKGDIQLALDAGFNEHMVKPVNFEKLQALLRRESSRIDD
jgi:signal transduction histidine kinase/DNA-binding response OmpR family regulator